jgi:hypothetical protein
MNKHVHFGKKEVEDCWSPNSKTRNPQAVQVIIPFVSKILAIVSCIAVIYVTFLWQAQNCTYNP